MISILVFNLMCFLSSCQDQEDHSISVEFKVDDKNMEISDDFEIILVNDEKVEKIIVRENQVFLPDLRDFPLEFDVIFVTGEHRLEFKSIKVEEIKLNQNMMWGFRVDNPPFYENYEGVDWSKVKKIHYWSFNPQEFGEGYEIIEPIL